jgi:exopolyphosphatase/pppGpp-phosphohydrolase
LLTAKYQTSKDNHKDNIMTGKEMKKLNLEPKYELTITVARNYGQNAGRFSLKPINSKVYTALVGYVEKSIANIELSNGELLGGSTTVTGIGQWLGQYEEVTVISTWIDRSELENVLDELTAIAEKVKNWTRQDCVALTVKELGLILV